MRAGLPLFLLVLLAVNLPVSAAPTVNACPGSAAVGRFAILIQPPDLKQALPVGAVNQIQAGDWLEYSPVESSGVSPKKKAKVAVVLVSSSDSTQKHIAVLPVEPANSAVRWKVPFRVGVMGFVVGPNGISVRKVHSFVAKNPDLMPQLADYAQRTSTIDALIQTLSKYEQSSPDSSSLQSVLNSFSTQYGVTLPAIGTNQSTTQQANALLHALLPAVSSSAPLTSRQVFLRGSTDLAASVATLFFGSPVGLATGATALFETMRNSIFPRTDFQPAFVSSPDSNPVTLCGNRQDAKSGTRIAYFWVRRIWDQPAPTVKLLHGERLPIGLPAEVKVTTASVAQLTTLTRAWDWRLVDRRNAVPIPVKVSTGSSGDVLTLGLQNVTLKPGAYHLAANWDWKTLPVAGTIKAVAFPDLSPAALAASSRARLISGNGIQWVRLTGADFEFVNQVDLSSSSLPDDPAKDLVFSRPLLKSPGEQNSLDVEIDCNALLPGSYSLLVHQRNGSQQKVPLVIHPPNPELEHLPIRLNEGRAQQTVVLKGSGLDRIERITSPHAVWTLSPASGEKASPTVRKATIRLGRHVQTGEKLWANLFVAGLPQPLVIHDAIEVIGPLPKIVRVERSFAAQQNVEMFPGEIPAEEAGSFSIQTKNAGPDAKLKLDCESGKNARSEPIPVGGAGPVEFDRIRPGSFFLSFEPNSLTPSGCLLTASIDDPTTGVSAPYALGRVVLLPRIDNFTLSNKKDGPNLYVGTVRGEDLQQIAKTGWNRMEGYSILGIPTPVTGHPQEQTLKILLPWPPPSPQSPLYIWLQGETKARRTSATY